MSETNRSLWVFRLAPVSSSVVAGFMFGIMFHRPDGVLNKLGWWGSFVAVCFVAGAVATKMVERWVVTDLSAFSSKEDAQSRQLLARYRCHVGPSAIESAALGKNPDLGMEPELAQRLLSLVRQANAHDTSIIRNGQNIAAVSELIANELSLPAPEIQRLRVAALLQDISLVGVDPELIHTQRPLVASERARIERAYRQTDTLTRDFHRWLGSAAPALTSYESDGIADQTPAQSNLFCSIIAVAVEFNRRWISAGQGVDSSPRELALALRRDNNGQFDRSVVAALAASVSHASESKTLARSAATALLQPILFGANAPIAAALAPAMIAAGGAMVVPPEQVQHATTKAAAAVAESVGMGSNTTTTLPELAFVDSNASFDVTTDQFGNIVIKEKPQTQALDPLTGEVVSFPVASGPSGTGPLNLATSSTVTASTNPDGASPYSSNSTSLPAPTDDRKVTTTTTSPPGGEKPADTTPQIDPAPQGKPEGGRADPAPPQTEPTQLPQNGSDASQATATKSEGTATKGTKLVAKADEYSLKTTSIATINVLANDELSTRDGLTLEIRQSPKHGIARVSNGKIVYFAGMRSGTDVIKYRVCSGEKRCSEATLTIRLIGR